jgi:mono/diheme cytochrome c family protein
MLRYATALAIVGLPLAAVAAQSDLGPPRWAANIARKQHVIMQGVPEPYRGLRDPSPVSSDKLRRGQAVFDRHCSSCHGWAGQGGGPEAFALVPAPADLEWLARTPKNRSEPYIFWSIAEGGASFESDMPAYKGTLAKNDIWAVTAYIRSGLPRSSP